MIITNIKYSARFKKNLKKLPLHIAKLAFEKEKLFQINPLHPSLRLHALKGQLKGIWSISITTNYRILFYRAVDGSIIFISIGKHDIYKSL